MTRTASIPKHEYSAILRLADQKVRTAEIAARYGVVQRTICIILKKARASSETDPPLVPATEATLSAQDSDTAAVERAAGIEAGPEMETELAVLPPGPEPMPNALKSSAPTRVREPRPEARSGFPVPKGRQAVVKSSPRSAFGLVARTEEGDETTMPFSSLEDLLSSLRGVFRSAAQNPEPVWFGIRPLERASLED